MPFDHHELQLVKEYKKPLSSHTPFEESELFNYINNHLTIRSEGKQIFSSLMMVREVKKKHQLVFEGTLLDLAVDLILEGELEKHLEGFHPERVYQEYNPRNVLNQTLHTIAYLRTPKSYSFLLHLIYPIEQWDNPNLEKMKNAYAGCEEREKVFADVRQLALGSIFQPLDRLGKKKVLKIKAIIESFPDSDHAKARMLKSMENWKKIYSVQTYVRYKH